MNTPVVLEGDVMDMLRTLEAGSVDCVVTSPPYWGLRDYGVSGQWGLEACAEDWLCKIQALGRALKRVLKADGTWWLNLGDSYSSAGGQAWGKNKRSNQGRVAKRVRGMAAKQLLGLPWRAALALQGDGWWVRGDEIWCKSNPMQDSAKDRASRAHEYIFQLTPRAHYEYAYEAVREESKFSMDGVDLVDGVDVLPGIDWSEVAAKVEMVEGSGRRRAQHHAGLAGRWDKMTYRQSCSLGRNRWSWRVFATARSTEAHYAVFPEELVEPYILASSRPGGVVLDPFCGTGTTLQVAARLGRRAIGIEVNPKDVLVARRKCGQGYLDLEVCDG